MQKMIHLYNSCFIEAGIRNGAGAENGVIIKKQPR